MRNAFLVAYDVADPKRLRRTYQKMLGFGDPLQYSVFHCELSPVEKQLLKETLWETLDWKEDRVMLVDLGPVGPGSRRRVEFWGQPRLPLDRREAVVV
ncbi:MAG TPA: CRISPR-associated endonuclease Cas2 [Planctomycetaceae bacterium]|nr:CRISPR-associated endonuclease Cas2 [Planctomycetaceae bacterium]HIQ20387.1 CRISPR-associated endonuclease Cas2 [Planctomycetota bacterium]